MDFLIWYELIGDQQRPTEPTSTHARFCPISPCCAHCPDQQSPLRHQSRGPILLWAPTARWTRISMCCRRQLLELYHRRPTCHIPPAKGIQLLTSRYAVWIHLEPHLSSAAATITAPLDSSDTPRRVPTSPYEANTMEGLGHKGIFKGENSPAGIDGNSCSERWGLYRNITNRQ